MSETAGHPVPGEQRISRVFEAWALAHVRTCIWKSADRWQEGVEGKTDFDILVEPSDIRTAMDILIAENWIPVDAESWRSFPGLFDFVTFEDGACLHVHLHERIVSGEKLLKSLRPPLTALYLRNIHQQSPAPTVKPELEFVLLLVRIVLKISWIDILGAFRRRSAISLYRNYVDEYQTLRAQCDRAAIVRMLAEPELSQLPAHTILAAYDNLATLGWRQRKALRQACQDWRAFDLPGTRPHAIVRRWQRRSQGVGKTLPFTGVAIAVCGPDGSGKTTTVRALQEILERQLRVRRLYMGGNLRQPGKLRRIIVWSLWLPYLLVRKACKALGWHAAVARLEALYAGIDRQLMRGEKRRRLKTARHAISKGEIVLFERYPLFHPFGDDMDPSVHSPSLNAAARPDVVILLDVNPQTAYERRPDDSREILDNKIHAFRQFAAQGAGESTQVRVLTEGASVETQVAIILHEIVALLGQRARQHTGINADK